MSASGVIARIRRDEEYEEESELLRVECNIKIAMVWFDEKQNYTTVKHEVGN